MMAEVELAEGDLGEVTRQMNEARSLGYPSAKLERLHAISLSRIGRFAEAEPILTRLWNAEGTPDPAVDEALARVYLKTYRLAQAQAVIRRWIQDAPADGRPYLWLTEIDRRIEVDNPGAWEQHYREALRRDPDLDMARLGLAETLRQAHRSAEADREYGRYLERHPDDPTALAGAGRNALELGEVSVAAERLDRALALAPADPSALKGRAEVDLQRRDLTSARRRLDRVLQSNRFDQEALHSRAGVRALLGDHNGAQADRAAFERLKRDQEELLKLRGRVLGEPGNLDLRRVSPRGCSPMAARRRDSAGPSPPWPPTRTMPPPADCSRTTTPGAGRGGPGQLLPSQGRFARPSLNRSGSPRRR